MVKTGSSYLSQSETPVTFGLGGAANVVALEIAWPTGKVERCRRRGRRVDYRSRGARHQRAACPLERKPLLRRAVRLLLVVVS